MTLHSSVQRGISLSVALASSVEPSKSDSERACEPSNRKSHPSTVLRLPFARFEKHDVVNGQLPSFRRIEKVRDAQT